MSIEAMNSVWKQSQASGRARLTLLAIADHFGEQGAWPSIGTLAKMVNASERSVKRDIQELVELGELRVELQNAPMGGQYKTNLYFITLSGVTDSVRGDRLGKSGVTNQASGVTDQVIRGDTVGTQTLKEPLIEPLREPFKKKPHKLPEDWKPNPDDWQVMEEHFPEVDLKLETHSFRDYWNSVAESKAKKIDWDATWRNWIRNAHKRSQTKREQDFDKLRREAERELRNEEG